MVSLMILFDPFTVRSHDLTSWKFLELKNVIFPFTGGITLSKVSYILVGEYAQKGKSF